MFNWRVTPVDGFLHVPVINFPDVQNRIFKRYPNIKWERKLHEHIKGYNISTNFPLLPEFSLIHEKTIKKQVSQNIFYNQNFSLEDNIRMN
jgi:hypothetical protein